jgi:hypothetical protein
MKRLLASLAALVIMVGFALFRFADSGVGSPCPDDPLRGVWGIFPERPRLSRLEVLGECVKVSGIAHSVKEGGDIEADQSSDGDVTFNLTVDDEHLERFGPVLHIEIVPVDQARVHAPEEGDHVCIVGTWAWDKTHGIAEIHPAFSVEKC